MKSIFSAVALIALMCILFAAPPAQAATKNVNCDEGQTIGHALETAKGNADRLEIFVTGTCNEQYINLRRDHVWITGQDGALINGTVRVFGANDIRFFDMAISGSGNGLSVTGNSNVSAWSLVLVGNGGTSLIVRRGSAVMLADSQIIGTCADIYDESCNDGVYVDAATLELRHTTISNSLHGIVAVAGARVILNDRRGDNSKVFENSIAGIQVDLKSLVDLRGSSHIHDNRTGAMHILAGSHARIATPEVTVEGWIQCDDPLWSNLSNPHYLLVDTNCWWW